MSNVVMRNDLVKEFKNLKDACDYRDKMLSEGYGAYYEHWYTFDDSFDSLCGFDSYYSVYVFERR